jgi:hypothetical protein
MDDPGAQPAYEQAADLDLQILGLLREDALSAELLAQTPSSREGGQGGAGEVLRRLEAMASCAAASGAMGGAKNPAGRSQTDGRSPQRGARSWSRSRGWHEPLTAGMSATKEETVAKPSCGSSWR